MVRLLLAAIPPVPAPSSRVPEATVVAPVYAFVPVRVVAAVPDWVRDPVPWMFESVSGVVALRAIRAPSCAKESLSV